MGIIPLEKLIGYKGNRYELSRAMMELAKTGSVLLKAETKYRQGKYIPTVMKNILDGNIKYEYADSQLQIDEEAPFTKCEVAEYDAREYSTDECVEEDNTDATAEEDYSYEDDFEDDLDDDFEDNLDEEDDE